MLQYHYYGRIQQSNLLGGDIDTDTQEYDDDDANTTAQGSPYDHIRDGGVLWNIFNTSVRYFDWYPCKMYKTIASNTLPSFLYCTGALIWA